MIRIPHELDDERDTRVRISRAWPRSDGRLTIEGREYGSGRLRAGVVDVHGGVHLSRFGEDPAFPVLESTVTAGELLVHRYRRRAVLRVNGVYRKFLAQGKASGVAEAYSLANAGLAGSGMLLPDVVTTDAFSVTLGAVPGMSLHELGIEVSRCPRDDADGRPGPPSEWSPTSRWSAAWAQWGHCWPRFTAASDRGKMWAGIPRHTAADEATTLKRWIDLAVSFDALGVPEQRLRNASATVTQALLAGTSPARLAHRDLHDKQLLFSTANGTSTGTGTVGIIDCDTLAIAEPALDLANLLVHLDFRVKQGLLISGAAAVGRHHILRAAETLDVPGSRIEAYASATALRLACVYAFRPPYREVARAWFNDLEARLEQIDSAFTGAP